MTTAKPKAKVEDDTPAEADETSFRDLEFKGDKLGVRVP